MRFDHWRINVNRSWGAFGLRAQKDIYLIEVLAELRRMFLDYCVNSRYHYGKTLPNDYGKHLGNVKIILSDTLISRVLWCALKNSETLRTSSNNIQ